MHATFHIYYFNYIIDHKKTQQVQLYDFNHSYLKASLTGIEVVTPHEEYITSFLGWYKKNRA